ncbi:unnamed protein product [Spirodela intermedia]|uniref:Methyltransferase small domain-containing protein n=1 Tax=Spirodela intermedia TaxID=51605 RepID=A0A7I8L6L5_SPIIN|nr:unnamed protein product [Spirodela intermedia]
MVVSRIPPPAASLLRRPPSHRLSRFSSAAVSPSATPPPTPETFSSRRRRWETPLFLRPLTHSASRDDLKAFHSWASSLVLSAAAAASRPPHPSDPEPAHLLRELRWLLQDASTESFDPHQLFSSSSSSAAAAISPVPLRAELGELYGIWRERVEERRPLQYLVGCEHWRDMVLVVREGVLIPRPETEAVVDMVAEVAVTAAAEGEGGGPWADLGTGSGALAVGIARVLGDGKGGKVYATDVSSDAIEVAKINVQRYGLEDKVEIRQGSWFQPLGDLDGKLAGLVSNPPYIPSRHLPGLQPEVSGHEPWLALDGGEDGLDHLLHLCNGSSSALRPGGFFVFETNGDDQSEFIADFVTTKCRGCFNGVKIVPDFSGIGRFVTGFRR